MSRFPPLLQKLHESPSATDSRRSGVFRGDVRSANWDGGGDLASGKDTTATAGYLLDYSSGSIQVQSIFAEGGTIGALTITDTLTMGTGGVLRTAASGARVELTNTDTKAISFYNSADTKVADISHGATTTDFALTGASVGDFWSLGFAGYYTRGSGSWFLQPDGAIYLEAGVTSPSTTEDIVFTIAGSGVLTLTAPTSSASVLQVYLEDAGSAAYPSLAFGGDIDTGWYLNATGDMAAATGGAKRFGINSTRVRAQNVSFLGLPVKATTGDPASPQNGDMYVNTLDNKVRVYADAAWRDLATW